MRKYITLGLGAVALVATLLTPTGNAAAAGEGWEGDDSPMRLEAVIPLWLPFLGLETTIESDSTFGENMETETEVSWVVIGSLELGYKQLAVRADAFNTVGNGAARVREFLYAKCI